MTTIPDCLISHEIVKTPRDTLFTIIFTNIQTNQRFYDHLTTQEYLISYLKDKIETIRFDGSCTFRVFINENGNRGKITLYKNHISLSPEFESFIKTYFWNHNFLGVIPENTFKLTSDTPNFLEGL